MKKILINVALTAIFAPIISPQKAHGTLTPVQKSEVPLYTPVITNVSQSMCMEDGLDNSHRRLLTQDCQPLTPCTQVKTLIASLSQSIDGWCKQLNDEFDQALNLVDECAHATPITKPMTISTPGTYCLQNDIANNSEETATIIITADDVFLNLNSHSISNAGGTALSISNNKNVTVTNGVIKNCAGTSHALTCTNVENLELSYLQVTNNINCLSLNTCTAFSIHHTLVERNTRQLLTIDNCLNSSINQSKIVNNTINLASTVSTIEILNSSSISLENCIIENNTTTSNFLLVITSIKNCTFSKCYFNKNTANITILSTNDFSDNTVIEESVFKQNKAAIVVFDTGFQTILNNCIFLNNTAFFGYRTFSSAKNCYVNKCTAIGNALDGFAILDATNGLVKNSICIGNGRYGFRNFNSTNIVFEGNYAAGNGSKNYDFIGAPLPYVIYSPVTGQFVDSSTTCNVINPLTQDNISVEIACALP